MSVQDRLADGQAHSHAPGFGRDERLEHVADFLCRETRSVITDGDQHTFCPGARDLHFDIPPVPIESLDRIDPVREEVHDDLLNLNRVDLDRRQIGGRRYVDPHVSTLGSTSDQRHYPRDEFLELDVFLGYGSLQEEST